MNEIKKYIMMCNCKEIQRMRSVLSRNVYGCTKCYVETWCHPSCCPECNCSIREDSANDGISDERGHIWLPNQEQIQKILLGKYDIANLFVTFVDWAKGTLAGENGVVYKISEFENFGSFRQLWLGFFMFDGFDKIWINNDFSWQSL